MSKPFTITKLEEDLGLRIIKNQGIPSAVKSFNHDIENAPAFENYKPTTEEDLLQSLKKVRTYRDPTLGIKDYVIYQSKTKDGKIFWFILDKTIAGNPPRMTAGYSTPISKEIKRKVIDV